MPAVSRKQRIAAAIAKHNPSKLHKSNRSMLKMSKSQLSDFSKKKPTLLQNAMKSSKKSY